MAGQIWVTNTLGGYMFAPNLSKKLRMAVQPLCKFRQFCDVKEGAVGLNKGQNFHWDVYSDVVTQGTTLVETSTIPETNFTITQGTMTLQEFGNSVPYTGLLDNLSEQPITEIIKKVLKNDCTRAFDIASQAEFNKTPLRVLPTGGTDTAAVTLFTNGTVTGTNNVALNKDHIKSIVDLMKERNIPGYQGEDYFAVAHPTTFRTFKNAVESVHQYTQQGFGMIMNGEIGRYEGVRFTEQTGIAKGTFANSKSNWCYFFGEDTVAEGIAMAEEIRGKIPGDYGRSRGIAWYALEGFAITQTAAANARIVKWDSQG
jgi:N4-gp56 family major capsid protein